MADFKTPNTKVRACLNCGILQTQQKFKSSGCPNCPFLQTNKNRNFSFTTSNSFKGQIGYLDTKRSWVAKWQRNTNNVPGHYAMIVEGGLEGDFIDRVEEDGRVYFDRSNSFTI